MHRSSSPWRDPMTWGIFAGILVLAGLGLVTCARAHDGHVSQLPPGFQDDAEINRWIASLRSRIGTNCCSKADGYLVEISWKTADGYVVYWEGKEYRVPETAVIDSPNRIGSAMVWWNTDEEGGRTVRCFLPGALY